MVLRIPCHLHSVYPCPPPTDLGLHVFVIQMLLLLSNIEAIADWTRGSTMTEYANLRRLMILPFSSSSAPFNPWNGVPYLKAVSASRSG